MIIEIEIPKAFEEHFKQDKFKDSLERIMADIKNVYVLATTNTKLLKC